jgi:hypothetical protein
MLSVKKMHVVDNLRTPGKMLAIQPFDADYLLDQVFLIDKQQEIM